MPPGTLDMTRKDHDANTEPLIDSNLEDLIVRKHLAWSTKSASNGPCHCEALGPGCFPQGNASSAIGFWDKNTEASPDLVCYRRFSPNETRLQTGHANTHTRFGVIANPPNGINGWPTQNGPFQRLAERHCPAVELALIQALIQVFQRFWVLFQRRGWRPPFQQRSTAINDMVRISDIMGHPSYGILKNWINNVCKFKEAIIQEQAWFAANHWDRSGTRKQERGGTMAKRVQAMAEDARKRIGSILLSAGGKHFRAFWHIHHHNTCYTAFDEATGTREASGRTRITDVARHPDAAFLGNDGYCRRKIDI
ncbi:hypothetical protein BKA70DRAFT_1243170 [Coprinopsis sp. MPI-PUGE-AT-0042]|nr:hypothetical protein BKA70DRAFT_1243170 [Coprinopsis sp. MPI-PUGE-AT-0042]